MNKNNTSKANTLKNLPIIAKTTVTRCASENLRKLYQNFIYHNFFAMVMLFLLLLILYFINVTSTKQCMDTSKCGCNVLYDITNYNTNEIVECFYMLNEK